MLERRDFIKIMGISAAALMFFPDELLFADTKDTLTPVRNHQPRKILYGSKYSGCSGWQGCESFGMPPDMI